MEIDARIFRMYDIRGIIDETLDAELMGNIAKAYARYVIEKSGKANPTIALGYDGRLSSPALANAASEGLASSGAHVKAIGCVPTPELYFAVKHEKLDAGMMITGSHNPKNHNGCKLMRYDEVLYGDAITQLYEWVRDETFMNGEGSVEELSVREAFLRTLLGACKSEGRPIKAVWDAGNGAAGEVMQALCDALPGEHTTLYSEIDGNFPNHHPDPTVAENMQDLIAKVEETGAELGIAFDGDGDRIGVVDIDGNNVLGDQLMQLYAAEIVPQNPGKTVIADVKTTQCLFDKIAELGGEPLMWQTGHSLIKTKMAETGAVLAGEASGHIFFADDYYGFDDALYAAVRLINLLIQQEKTFTELVDALPKTFSTPEIRLDCAEDRKHMVAGEIEARLKDSDVEVNTIDGVRVNTADGWWLVRASNTQAAIIARAEAKSEEGFTRLVAMLSEQLAASGVELPLNLRQAAA